MWDAVALVAVGAAGAVLAGFGVAWFLDRRARPYVPVEYRDGVRGARW